MRVISIVGARPQFVKAGIVSRKLRQTGVKEILIHTGQHYDFNMSDVFFKELGIPEPDYYLGVGSGNHGEQTGKMLIKIEKVLIKENPDIVIVYGDTNSTLAGALAASKQHIKIAHVESGLRSYNKFMPEEINRILTDHISDILFVPTDVAVENLKKEGITKGVYKVGDVMLDVALEISKKVKDKEVLNKYNLKPKEFIFVTIHRVGNTDNYQNLKNIWGALLEISNNIKVFFPVHPRTKKKMQEFGLIEGFFKSEKLILAEPVSYFEIIALEKNAKVIITDSGGVQKEGYFWGTPCIIPRDETEWIELVEIGFNRLVERNKDRIKEAALNFDREHSEVNKSFYGDGKASEKIVEVLLK